MIIITANYKGKRIMRKAFSDFQAFTIISRLAAEGCTNIGMREKKECQD